MFILEKKNFLNLDQHAHFGIFRFGHILLWFLAFKRLEVIQLRQSFVDHFWLWKTFILQQNKQNPFTVPSTLINVIEDHFRDSTERHVDDRTTLYQVASLFDKIISATERQRPGRRQALMRQPLKPHLQASIQLPARWLSLVTPPGRRPPYRLLVSWSLLVAPGRITSA